MCHRPPKPLQTDPPGKDNHDSYGDGDIPEIDTQETIPIPSPNFRRKCQAAIGCSKKTAGESKESS